MKLKILQAKHGDAILFSYVYNGQPKNILIDGGPRDAFETRLPRRRAGELKKAIKNLVSKGQIIDLLILTHVDDDHIHGILKWFESHEFSSNMVGKILFNSGRLISEYYNKDEIKENLIQLNIFQNSQTSIKQGVKFEDYIEKHKIWHRELIKVGQEINEFGVNIHILSPNLEKLKPLLEKWEDEAPVTITSSARTDYHFSIDQLMQDDTFSEDQSVHNGSSIAFILSYKEKNIVFLGDAHPEPIIQALKRMGYKKSKPLKAEFVKVSHHGSKYNTNKELLELLDCNNYIISTDGSKHALPSKRCLARIITNKKKPIIYFNYPHLINRIFTAEELESNLFETASAEFDILI